MISTWDHNKKESWPPTSYLSQKPISDGSCERWNNKASRNILGKHLYEFQINKGFFLKKEHRGLMLNEELKLDISIQRTLLSVRKEALQEKKILVVTQNLDKGLILRIYK